MQWHKLGQIFAPERQYPWMVSHAANPVAEHLHGDVFRIYFSCRDGQNRSHIGFLDVDLREPANILDIASQPVLAPGDPGTFDDSGVSLGCLLSHNGQKYLYYVGWNLGVTVPWRNSIGLAIYNPDTQMFERYSLAPILDRNAVDPYSLSYPFVLRERRRYHMWYGSNLSWGRLPQDMAHVIKYASSRDGVHWQREGHIAISFKDASEYAISRPCVLRDGALYKMWYAYRGASYRIGYAESRDGLHWERKDEQAGISVSPAGWDAEMVCYPFVFDHRGRRYLLYCGNGYGKTGFGLAVLA